MAQGFSETLYSQKHVFGNKNCWSLNVSLYYISCLDCLSRLHDRFASCCFQSSPNAWVTLYYSNFYALIGQNLTGEFMRKIYAASWNLFTVTAEADRVFCQLVMFSTGCRKWNSAAIKSLLLFMASLFIGFLVEKYVACQSRMASIRFSFSPCLIEKSEAIVPILDSFQELHLEW